ncbi:hypothetical protein AALP_AAs41929U000100 [Arabis alpina]|uniref:Retrotransposon gag domain-containing protein n=1 Tax=Arabis alpina TaxID=50452 RepID=A0A087G142_ARAAL|nr:hypothetical protein AALP_AAs41929U000100 [Arabis alpina]
MAPQAAGGAKAKPSATPRLQVKRRAGFPIQRDWPIGFESEPRIPKAEQPTPRAAEHATVTFHPVERVLANGQQRFDTFTQGDKTVEEYFKEFMLLKTATKCTQDPDAVLLRFWNGLRTEFDVALSRSTYNTATRLDNDAAILEKMGRDKEPGKEQGMFGDLGNHVPVPPTAAAYEDRASRCQPNGHTS